MAHLSSMLFDLRLGIKPARAAPAAVPALILTPKYLKAALLPTGPAPGPTQHVLAMYALGSQDLIKINFDALNMS
jgi:hypothetical protein